MSDFTPEAAGLPDMNVTYEFNLDNHNDINRILNALQTINGENAVYLPGHSVMEQVAANVAVLFQQDLPQTDESDMGKIATILEAVGASMGTIIDPGPSEGNPNPGGSSV